MSLLQSYYGTLFANFNKDDHLFTVEFKISHTHTHTHTHTQRERKIEKDTETQCERDCDFTSVDLRKE